MAGMNRTEPPLPLQVAAAKPTLLMQALIVPGARTSEGQLIAPVSRSWFDIIALLNKDQMKRFGSLPGNGKRSSLAYTPEPDLKR
jgi:hypothetical protein